MLAILLIDSFSEAIRFHEHMINCYIASFGIILTIVSLVFAYFSFAANKKYKKLMSDKEKIENLIIRARKVIPILEEKHKKVISDLENLENHLQGKNTMSQDLKPHTITDAESVAVPETVIEPDSKPENEKINQGQTHSIISSFENSAWKLVQLFKWNDALELYEKIIILKNDYYVGWFGKGVCLMNLREYSQAIENFIVANKLKPNNYSILFNLAYCYYGLQLYDRGLFFNQSALSVDENSIDANNMMGITYFNQQKYSLASEKFLFVLKLDPSNEIAKKYLQAINKLEWL